MSKSVEVLLPLALPGLLTYKVPDFLEDKAMPGYRVQVPLGRGKLYTGIIVSVKFLAGPDHSNLKQIDSIPDDIPVVDFFFIQLLEWIAEYYFCTRGEVLLAALPSKLRIDSQWYISLVHGKDLTDCPNNELSFKTITLLETVSELSEESFIAETGIRQPRQKLKFMEEAGFIEWTPRIKNAYTPKTEKWVELENIYKNNLELENVFEKLKRAPKQEEALLLVAGAFFAGQMIKFSDLLLKLKSGSAIPDALKEKGIIKYKYIEKVREVNYFKQEKKDIILNTDQVKALEKISKFFEEGKPVLLHGVTGSGKTEIYLECMKKVISEGKKVLYLVPEIALTEHLTGRIEAVFSEQTCVYHSRLTDNERAAIWMECKSGKWNILIGVRSAVFLPIDNLGLVIVDEEHDPSFRQREPNPRYHARNVAVWMGMKLKIPVLMGSATPSLESWKNAEDGKYGLAELPDRIEGSKQPVLEFVDMRHQVKNHLSHGPFSDVFLNRIKETLKNGEQAVVFLNRRGYAPFLLCSYCGYVPKCIRCDISLTFHKHTSDLKCHYCGYSETYSPNCKSCTKPSLHPQGPGTERLEEYLSELLPEAIIARLDLDSIKSRKKYMELLNRFSKNEIQVLVGTQMISKGFDFSNVTFAGIVLADQLLNFPEYRTHESALQLMMQVCGRAGRGDKPGHVVIQTYMPEHQLFKFLSKPWSEFYSWEFPQRQSLNYPPAARLIRFEIRYKEKGRLEKETKKYSERLIQVFGSSILGPDYMPIELIQGTFRMQMLLKISKKTDPANVREKIRQITEAFRLEEKPGIHIIIEQDA